MKKSLLVLISCMNLSFCLFASERDGQFEYVPDDRYEQFNQVTHQMEREFRVEYSFVSSWENRCSFNSYLYEYHYLHKSIRKQRAVSWKTLLGKNINALNSHVDRLTPGEECAFMNLRRAHEITVSLLLDLYQNSAAEDLEDDLFADLKENVPPIG